MALATQEPGHPVRTKFNCDRTPSSLTDLPPVRAADTSTAIGNGAGRMQVVREARTRHVCNAIIVSKCVSSSEESAKNLVDSAGLVGLPGVSPAKSTRCSCALGLTVVPAIDCGSCCGQHNACSRLRVRTQRLESWLLPRLVRQSSEPNFLGLPANTVSMLHHPPTSDCCSLRRCGGGGFPFAIYPRLPGLAHHHES